MDVNDSLATGKALDILQANAVSGKTSEISFQEDYSCLSEVDAIVITAGLARAPGMSREELISTNYKIMREIAAKIAKHAKHEPFVIVVTNPLDIMALTVYDELKFSKKKVAGMAGILDSGRMKYFLSEELKISADCIETCVLGTHGDTMLPILKYCTIAGIPLLDFVKNGGISETKLEEIIQRTKDGGAEIVKYLKNGSAFYAPAASIYRMLESYLHDSREILHCSAYLETEYGVTDSYLGVPVIIGRNGIEKIIEVDLNAKEREVFSKSAENIKNSFKKMSSS